jgi:hypothetical protein
LPDDLFRRDNDVLGPRYFGGLIQNLIAAEGSVAGRARKRIVDSPFATKSGLGIQLFESTLTNTRDFTRCNGPIVTRTAISPISFSDSVTGCSSISTSHSVDVTTESSISPYITVGAGIERNFGRVFGRVEGEFIDYLGQFNGKTMQYQPFYETRFTAGAGYRF